MPRYDYRCDRGHVFEAARSSASCERARCALCGLPATLVWLEFPGSRGSPQAQRFRPVIVFRDRKGKTIFPGRDTDRPPGGFDRIELRTVSEIRQFEKSVNKKLSEENHDSKLREQLLWDVQRKPKLDQLRRRMPSMSDRERSMAQQLLDRSSRRSFSRDATQYEAGFRITAFSDDASNRLAWDDCDTRGKPDRK